MSLSGKFLAVICVSLIFMLVLQVDAFAFQFEGFEWGTTKDEMKNILKGKGKMVEEYKDAILYEDVILNENFEIQIFFTRATQEMYSILIKKEAEIALVSRGNAVRDLIVLGRKMKSMLTEKYGKPEDISDWLSAQAMYQWDDKRDIIELEFSKMTTFTQKTFFINLAYYNGKLYDEYVKEDRESESARF